MAVVVVVEAVKAIQAAAEIAAVAVMGLGLVVIAKFTVEAVVEAAAEVATVSATITVVLHHQYQTHHKLTKSKRAKRWPAHSKSQVSTDMWS